jgi:hypothetical protein
MALERAWQTIKSVFPSAGYWPASRTVAAMGVALSFASNALAEDGWRWRVNKMDDGRLLLAFTEYEAGDDTSGLSFSCKPSSGRIEIRGSTNKQQRQVFADLIKADSYPTLKVGAEDAFWELSHSDIGGWEFHFEIAADGAAFGKFRKTGQFLFKVGTLAVDNGVRKVGIEQIAEFENVCRTAAADKTPQGSKPK